MPPRFIEDVSLNNSFRIRDLSDKIWSSQEVILAADNFCSKMRARSLVFILCDWSIGSIIAYLGCLRGNHVPVLLGASQSSEAISSAIVRFNPNYLFLPRGWSRRLNGRTICSEHFFDLVDNSNEQIEMNEDLALLLPTSGSTGDPNLVRLTNANLDSNAKSISQSLSLSPDDNALVTLPMNYSYGLSIVNSQLLAGGTITLNEHSVIDRKLWSIIREVDITYLGGVPVQYETLNRLGIRNILTGRLRLLTQAGGRLNPSIVQSVHADCCREDVEFVVMYGQTEATARMSVLPHRLVGSHPDSVGFAIDGGCITIKTLEGFDNGNVGEVVYQGPNVSMGYAQTKADLNQPDQNLGVLRTGDLGYLNADGLLFLKGRIKRIAKLSGTRLNLDQIEQGFLSRGIACGVVSDDKELVVCIEETGIDVTLIMKEIQQMGIPSRVLRVLHLSELPRTHSNKLNYSELYKKCFGRT